MTGRQLEVCINDQVVGFLRETNDLWTFEYAQAWAASLGASTCLRPCRGKIGPRVLIQTRPERMRQASFECSERFTKL